MHGKVWSICSFLQYIMLHKSSVAPTNWRECTVLISDHCRPFGGSNKNRWWGVDEFEPGVVGQESDPSDEAHQSTRNLFELCVINSNQYGSHTSPGSALPINGDVHNHRAIGPYKCRVWKLILQLLFHISSLILWTSVGRGPHPHVPMHWKIAHKYDFTQI